MKVTSIDLQYHSEIENHFPKLDKSNYSITSPFDRHYNCIAWVAEDTNRWWWPDLAGQAYWPKGVERSESIESFQTAFEQIGYEVCSDSILEIGFLKIAFYINAQGVPTHGARQNSRGIWLSKLGKWPDIEHNTLEDLYSPLYGFRVGLIMMRALPVHNC